ncbi:hypothetical protein KKH43_03370 [Patescibacteria group bacterium]|nr:hypothetical protein [Patescibacteria group bacterium]
MKLKKIALISILILMVGGCTVQKETEKSLSLQMNETVYEKRIKEKMDLLDMSGWETYHDDKHGYSLKYDSTFYDDIFEPQDIVGTTFDRITSVQGGLILRKHDFSSSNVDISFLQTDQHPDDWFAEASESDAFFFAPNFKRTEFTSEVGEEVIRYSSDIVDWHEQEVYNEVLFIQNHETNNIVMLSFSIGSIEGLPFYIEDYSDDVEERIAHFLKVANQFTFTK